MSGSLACVVGLWFRGGRFFHEVESASCCAKLSSSRDFSWQVWRSCWTQQPPRLKPAADADAAAAAAVGTAGAGDAAAADTATAGTAMAAITGSPPTAGAAATAVAAPRAERPAAPRPLP